MNYAEAYTAYRPYVFKCLRFIADENMREDCYHDAWAKVLSMPEAEVDPDSLKPFLAKLAINAYRDFVRRFVRGWDGIQPKVVFRTEAVRKAPEPVMPPVRWGEAGGLEPTIDRAMSRLSSAEWDAIMMHAKGVPHKAIAAASDITVHAATMRVHNARRKMQEYGETLRRSDPDTVAALCA